MNSAKSRGLSSERGFKSNLLVQTSRFDSQSSTQYSPSPLSQMSKNPRVQDSIMRLTNPIKKKPFEIRPSFSPDKFSSPMLSPLKMRPMTATSAKSARGEAFDFLAALPSESNGGFPNQNVVEGNLKNSLVTLKTVVREYEEKQTEKKIMSKVVDQLRAQIAGLQARKVGFSKNFEKLHKDALIMNDACQLKENQRILIEKNISQVKDGVIMFDREIQESISMNVEVAKAIKMEQQEIIRLRNEVAEMKKVMPAISKEKDKLRNELQVSSKLLKNMEERFASLTREKATFVHHIENSKSLRKGD